ncbi:MAG: hypothetical protein HUJ22_10080 [Gracilimonas sp.]|uniref:hypothetical protein n=1 Tax=Gracilimonas sp. TaxID=1974203 RepID=UPI0019B597C3|nr:hypothetical protein [Gracilimonas sp.]MBD3616908.1 hypothetical protein [Gracilimonas sp.]
MRQSKLYSDETVGKEKLLYPDLYPSRGRDQKIALALSLWCLLTLSLLFSDLLDSPTVNDTLMSLLLIMWLVYGSIFLANFIKKRIFQVLWILFTGCLPVLVLLGTKLGNVQLEYFEPIKFLSILIILAVLYEMLIMLASVVYLFNYWIGWFKGSSRGPTFKVVSLQFTILVILFILFTEISN